MNVSRKRTVAVIGASKCTKREAEFAEEFGRMLAQDDVVIICGGRGGVMEAVCRGAQSVGGTTIGLLPGENPNTGNPFLSISIPTGLSHARNALVVLAGEVVVAIGGNTGTLSEIALAKTYGREVVGLHTWTAIRNDNVPLDIVYTESPEIAHQLVLELLDAG
jgi:uncharacterized protein (TIGR00725 family)